MDQLAAIPYCSICTRRINKLVNTTPHYFGIKILFCGKDEELDPIDLINEEDAEEMEIYMEASRHTRPCGACEMTF